jgi:tRNA modification GTPase
LRTSLPLDLVAVDLHAALDHIGEITGHVTSEDILDQIFREFCIGK